MSDKKNFQVDGVGINAEHHLPMKEIQFIESVLPGMPDRFGSKEQKTEWAKGAFKLMNESFKPEVKETKVVKD